MRVSRPRLLGPSSMLMGQTLVLHETALTLIPALLPILPETPTSVESVLRHISIVSRPREVTLALNEALQHIEERIEGIQMSDEEDEAGFGREGVDYEELGRELVLVLKTYTRGTLRLRAVVTREGLADRLAVPRIKTAKSTPTLLTLSEASEHAIANLSQRLSAQTSRMVVAQVCHLVDACWTWVQGTNDQGGEQRVRLTSYLRLGFVKALWHELTNAEYTLYPACRRPRSLRPSN